MTLFLFSFLFLFLSLLLRVGGGSAYHKLDANVTMIAIRARKSVFINSRMMKNGMGKIKRSVTRLAQLIKSNVAPCSSRPKHCRPPNVVAAHVLPVRGGQMKMSTAQGMTHAPTLNTRIA